MNKIIIKLIAIISSIYGLILNTSGIMSLTYFTILSNIFITIVLCIFLYKDILDIKGKHIEYSNTLYIVKFLATISITLTFLVFMFILAPTFNGGIISAYTSLYYSSFALHFLTPLLSIIDFILYDKNYKSKSIHALYAIIPPLVYTGFIFTISSFGVRWGSMHAPYNFMNFGAKTGWFGFDLSLMGWETLGIGVFYMLVILIIIFILLGLLFLKIKK